ncbi:hypothetical protein NL676_024286 [Syzygium grande]|nr:hypothetical protein NL676_024286 [Syzygium grande]
MQVYENGTLGLKSLTLFVCSFNAAWLMNLKLLKHVSFGWIAVRMSTLNDLLMNCSFLESLRLKKCWNLEHPSIFESDLALKTLAVDNCNFYREWFGIEAPNLRFFKYSGSVGIFDLILTRHLEEAELDFGSESEFHESGGDLLHRLLSSLDCARVLKVCSFTLQDVFIQTSCPGLLTGNIFFSVTHRQPPHRHHQRISPIIIHPKQTSFVATGH